MEARAPLGILDQGWDETRFSDAETLSGVYRVAEAADRLGFASFWMGEHHGARPGSEVHSRFAVPEIVLATIAARTTHLTVGTGVKVLRTTNSFRSAEELASLDLVSGGRAEFGIGLGSSPTPMTREQKAADFRDRFDELLAILRGTHPEHPPLTPAPAADLADRIWAAPRDAETQEYLASNGVNLVVGQAEVAEVQAGYVDTYRKAGATGKVRGVRLVYVAPTHEEAVEECRRSAEFYFQLMGGTGGYVGEAIAQGHLPAEIATFDDLLRAANFVVGSPEEVAQQLNEYIATTGVDRLDIMVRIPYLSLDQIVRTMELVQEQVAPSLVFGR